MNKEMGRLTSPALPQDVDEDDAILMDIFGKPAVAPLGVDIADEGLDSLSPEELENWVKENAPHEFDGSYDELYDDGTFRTVRCQGASPSESPPRAFTCSHGEDGKPRQPTLCDVCAGLEQDEDARLAREGLDNITIEEFVIDMMSGWQLFEVWELCTPAGRLDNFHAAEAIAHFIGYKALPTDFVVDIIAVMQNKVYALFEENPVTLRKLREDHLEQLKSSRQTYRQQGIQFCEESFAAEIAVYEELLA